MSNKKLYIITVKYEYAVVAENEFEAKSYVDETADEIYTSECCSCQEATMEHYLPDGWNDSCLVYGNIDRNLSILEAKELYVTKKETTILTGEIVRKEYM